MNDDDLFNFLINFGNVSDNLIILDDFNFSDITWDTLSFRSSTALRSLQYTYLIKCLLDNILSKSTTYFAFNYPKGDYQGLHQHLFLCISQHAV